MKKLVTSDYMVILRTDVELLKFIPHYTAGLQCALMDSITQMPLYCVGSLVILLVSVDYSKCTYIGIDECQLQ